MQQAALLDKTQHAPVGIRIVRQGRLDGRALGFAEHAVHEGLQKFVVEIHGIAFRLGRADSPSICRRSFSRPRESRDITVPIGTPSARLTSS